MLLNDNIKLKYLFHQKKLKARQARWLAFMSEYDFEIRNIKGKENIVADALSRQQHELQDVLISGYESAFKNMLKTLSSSDYDYNNPMEKCTHRYNNTKDSAYHIDTEGFMCFKN